MLGLDCEWVTELGGRRRPVALLQLATLDGLCVLVRLCRLRELPEDLRVSGGAARVNSAGRRTARTLHRADGVVNTARVDSLRWGQRCRMPTDAVGPGGPGITW